MLKAPRAYIHV